MPLDKKTARRSGLNARHALNEEERKQKDAKITEKVIEAIRDRNVIGCYVSMKDEADTYGIIEWCLAHDKTVAVPRVEGRTLSFYEIHGFDDLKEGTFSVLEPFRGRLIEPEEIDFMIVPLSAFDEENNRTGYGKGYYDSILSRCAYKAGIAYDVQKCDRIISDPWDVPLDQVIYS